MVKIIDGKKIAGEIIKKIRNKTDELVRIHNIRPGIATILVGDDEASQIYIQSKHREAENCGFYSVVYKFNKNISEQTIINLIETLNLDILIHGILVQLPLPKNIKKENIIKIISPEKDIDGFHEVNVGKLISGTSEVNGFTSCTPAGIMILIHQVRGNNLSGLDAVIVGRSNLVGKPISLLLLEANATITIAHRNTYDLPEVVRSADILIAAVGQPEMIKADWIKPKSTIIDVGINRIFFEKNNKKITRIVGDVDYNKVSLVAREITPVPGGVGPMTIAMLMQNTLKSACRSVNVEPLRFF